MSAPLPPSDLLSRRPRIDRLRAGASVHRFYTASYEPVHFDTSSSGRLNAPDGSYGVMYVARDSHGAFAETFLRNPGALQIDGELLRRKAYVRFEATSDLRFVRLAGPHLARLGATAEVTHGGLPYDVPQRWSAVLHAHTVGADGIAYNARHDDEARCYAVFARAADKLREAERRVDLDAEWFWRTASRYGVGLAPTSRRL